AAKAKANEKVILTLTHATGGGDWKHAKISANPSPEDRRDVIARLEGRRAELVRSRTIAAGRLRAALLSGNRADEDALRDRVRALELELERSDRGLEQLYDLARDGAERGAERRTRVTCVELATARLEAVKAALVARGVP